jgi:hypothetical protein
MDRKAQLEFLNNEVWGAEKVILALVGPEKANSFHEACQAHAAVVKELNAEPARYSELKALDERYGAEVARAWQVVLDALDPTNPEHKAALEKRREAFVAYKRARHPERNFT